MKNDELYTYYIQYLNMRLIEGELSRGSFSLLSISRTMFEDFKHKFKNDSNFALTIARDKKIDDIIDDEEN